VLIHNVVTETQAAMSLTAVHSATVDTVLHQIHSLKPFIIIVLTEQQTNKQTNKLKEF
jgi:hypothetical protein